MNVLWSACITVLCTLPSASLISLCYFHFTFAGLQIPRWSVIWFGFCIWISMNCVSTSTFLKFCSKSYIYNSDFLTMFHLVIIYVQLQLVWKPQNNVYILIQKWSRGFFHFKLPFLLSCLVLSDLYMVTSIKWNVLVWTPTTGTAHPTHSGENVGGLYLNFMKNLKQSWLRVSTSKIKTQKMLTWMHTVLSRPIKSVQLNLFCVLILILWSNQSES